LAELVGGQVVGDAATPIHGAAVLREVAAGQITLVDQPGRMKQLAATEAAAAVVEPGARSTEHGADNDEARMTNDELRPSGIRHSGLRHSPPARCPLLLAENVHAAFAKIITHFRPPRTQAAIGVSPLAIVSSTARLGQNVNVHPGATVGDDCRIGDGTTILPAAQILPGSTIGRDATIGPAAVLYENTIVGDRSIIHGGAVIGAHGFGYHQEAGRHVPAPQLGYVRIGCDVEIGAGTTIDRGTYGATSIGDGTKIDNLVQIAHNCQIGRHNLICAQVGIAGSTTTGDYVVMGGQAGVRDHVHIGSRAMLSAMAGITNDVPDGAAMMGIPATPEREQKLKQAALAKLPEMRKEFKAMRRAIAALEKAVGIESAEHHDADQAA
jgi:UDP-3-O-[3-hydroxymyristoyl] glucosamine N-acyltransferase